MKNSFVSLLVSRTELLLLHTFHYKFLFFFAANSYVTLLSHYPLSHLIHLFLLTFYILHYFPAFEMCARFSCIKTFQCSLVIYFQSALPAYGYLHRFAGISALRSWVGSSFPFCASLPGIGFFLHSGQNRFPAYSFTSCSASSIVVLNWVLQP